MIRRFAVFFFLLWATAATPVSAQDSTGRLLFVGGGLSLDNADVYHAFLDNRPDDAPGIAIVAAAPSHAAELAATFAGELMFYGVPAEQIAVVPLALVDDPETPDVDESEWAGNGSDPEEIAKVEAAGAIWIIGGDRLRQLLVAPEGADTPLLAAIRARHAAGAIVGASSADASAMGSRAIVRGDAFEALFGEVLDTIPPENEMTGRLVVASGLGLFDSGLVDAHFAQRGRLGRLARAMMAQPPSARLGLGIDDDTALLVDPGDNAAWVVGQGSVTLLSGRGATVSATGFADIRLSRLQAGDMLNLATRAITPASGRERVTEQSSVFGGLWPSVRLLDPLESETRQLYTSEQRRAASATFEVNFAEEKRGAIFTFLAGADTRYWRGAAEEGWNGTLTGVRLSLETGAPRPYRH